MLRAALTGVIFGSLFSIARHRGLDARVAALLTLAAFVVAAPAMALRPQLLGHGLLRRAPRHHRPAADDASTAVDGAAARRDLGERPRQLLPRAGQPRPGVARRPPRSVRAGEHDAGRGAGERRSRPASHRSDRRSGCTRSGCRRTRRSAPASRSGSRHRSARVPGILFFASAGAVVALLARRGRPTPWPTLAWLAVFFVDRRVRGARGRLVAARGDGRRGRPARATGGDGANRVDHDPPRERPGGRGHRRRRGRAAAGVAPDRAADRGARRACWRMPRRASPRRCDRRSPRATGSSTRSAGARGSSTPSRRPSSRSIRASSSSRPGVWREVDAVEAAGDGWAEWLDASDVRFVVTMPSQRALADRLIAAGWGTHYEGPDGAHPHPRLGPSVR